MSAGKQSKPKITDVIKIAHLQPLLDSFAATAVVGIVLFDPDGKPLVRSHLENRPGGYLVKAVQGEVSPREHVARIIGKSRQNDQPFMDYFPETLSLVVAQSLVIDGAFVGCCVVEYPGEEIRPADGKELFDHVFRFVQLLKISIAQLLSTSMEMAKKRQSIQELERENELFRQFVENSTTIIYICDWDTGEILVANEAYCRRMGLKSEEIPGKICWEVSGVGERKFRKLSSDAVFDTNTSGEKHYWTYHDEKRDIWLQCSGHLVPWPDNRRALMVTWHDVSNERVLNEELAYLIYHDSRTGQPNGQKLLDDVQLLVDFAKQKDQLPFDGVSMRVQDEKGREDVSLVCFDLSSLRQITDAYGRDASDELLKIIIRWCYEQNFGDLAVYSLENYEFCLLLHGQTDQHVISVAQQLLDRFGSPWFVSGNGQEFSFLCSVFVSVIFLTRDHEPDTDILALVSRTLEGARKTNALFFHNEFVERMLREDLRLELSLKDCIRNDMQGFDVYFHPIVELSSGIWRGVEALCRWESPEMGRISPERFIRDAERLGMIDRLGSWVMETSLWRSKELELDKKDGYFVSVNVSSTQLMKPGFADDVISCLARYDYPGEKLNLEITESAKMIFNTFTISVFEKLRSHGIKLALDDFGTGYSSFNNLKNIPVSFLKTERDFVTGIEDDTYMQYLFYIMSEVSHANDMKLIAEGIETAEQLLMVRDNGVDYAQGFLFSEPLSFDALRIKLEHFYYFCQSDPIFASISRPEMNINQWLNGREAYLATPNIFKMLNRCGELLAFADDMDVALYEVLEVIGDHFGIGRVFAYRQQFDRAKKQFYAWSREDIPVPDTLSSDDFLTEMDAHSMPFFKRDGMVMSSDTETLEEPFRTLFLDHGIRSFLTMPVWDKDRLIGVIGFNEWNSRTWSSEEVLFLWNFSMLVSTAFRREHSNVESNVNRTLLINMLNRTGLNAFVSDLETHEILWVNDAANERYGEDMFQKGRKCYETIEKRSTPCPYCRLPELTANPDLTHIVLEHHNKILDRTFMVYHSIIPWEGSKKAHVEYFLDMTDHYEVQKKLEYLATTDTATNVANRITIMTWLEDALEKTRRKNQPLSIALANISRMREINRQYGHKIGDKVLEKIAEALRICVRGGDLVGRVGGDEFMVILPNCPKGVAAERMKAVRQYLAQMEPLAEGIVVDVNYGLAEVSEVTHVASGSLASGLIELAEYQLSEAKIAGSENSENPPPHTGGNRRPQGSNAEPLQAAV